MKLVRESVSIFTLLGDLDISHQERLAEYVELCGRQCYQSTHKIEPGSSIKFIKNLISSGHHSVLEHANISAKIVTNRGVTHELVRHRLAAISQESTRYCNYSGDRFGNELSFIIPVWISDEEVSRHFPDEQYDDGYMNNPVYVWVNQIQSCEDEYLRLLQLGWTPEKAREILPNSLKTTIVMTMNLRMWRHVMAQRLDKKCHPEMRHTMSLIGREFLDKLPLFFEDIINKELLDDARGDNP